MRPANSFTSGPWKVTDDNQFVRSTDGRERIVAEAIFIPQIVPRPERAANARLIAAAPDLLASLTDAAIRCAGLHGDKFREHRCVTCSKWLDVIEKAVAP